MSRFIPDARYDQLSIMTVGPFNMAWAARNVILNPAYTHLVFDVYASNFTTTPFGQFLYDVCVVSRQILMRNLGETHGNSKEEARRWNYGFLNLSDIPACRDIKIKGPDDYRLPATSMDIVGLDEFVISPEEAIGLANIFCVRMYLKERRSLMRELVEAWRDFRSKAKDDPALSGFIEHGWFMSELADRGFDAVIEDRLRADRKSVDLILGVHELCAREHDVEPRTGEIRKIINTYSKFGYAYPIIMDFRRLAPEAIAQKRKEFGLRDPMREGTRLHFLKMFNDFDVAFEMMRRGVNLKVLKKMVKDGSFGQEKDSRDSNGLSVEHMAPIMSGDNDPNNNALATIKANMDFGRLILLQTDFLTADKITTAPNGTRRITLLGSAVPVIALRPAFITLKDGRKIPDFIKYADWAEFRPRG
jgi:hypothetical protein